MRKLQESQRWLPSPRPALQDAEPPLRKACPPRRTRIGMNILLQVQPKEEMVPVSVLLTHRITEALVLIGGTRSKIFLMAPRLKFALKSKSEVQNKCNP